MRPHLWLALVFTAAVYLVGLGNVPLVLPDEPREAEIAREVWIDGPLHAPKLDGEVFVEKPPLAYWLSAAIFAVARQDPPGEVAVRLGPAIFTLATAFTIFLLGKGWFSARHGALAALIFACSPQVISHGRRLTTDPALLFAVTVSVGSALTALRAVSGRRFLGFLACSGAGFALGFLAKGPIAVVLGLGAISGAILVERGIRGFFTLRALAILATAALFLAPSVGLWLWMLWRDGGDEAVSKYLAYHTGGASGGTDHQKPIWFYILNAPDGFLPWLAFLPFAGFGRAHDLAPGKHPEFHLRHLVAWVLVPLALLSLIGQKRDLYVLPLYPPLALLAASAILEPPREGRLAAASRVVWSILFLGLLAAGTIGPAALSVNAIVRAMEAGAGTGRLVELGATGLVLACAAALTILVARKDETETSAPQAYPFMTASLGAIVAISLFLFVEPTSARAAKTLRPAARSIVAELAKEPGTTLYGYALSEGVRGAVPYELGRTFPLLKSAEEVHAKLKAEPEARILFEKDPYEQLGRPGRVVREVSGPRSYLILVAPK